MSQSFEQFGKYILLEKLASGGMAEVFLSKSNGANGVSKFLAIKRILPQYTDNVDFIEMFKEEAKIAVNLNHSNVVAVNDFGMEKGQFYLVMEYVEGRNLRQVINELKKKNYQFTIEQIVYIIKEVAAGLDHAHRCIDGSTGKPLNITHRDMSPQNIMVSFEGEVKVIDFGIAKAETQIEATKAGTLKGKFGYMSPEQADGLPIDLRTDVFSLGICLWELLAGERLFSASSEAAILRKIRECQISSIRKMNPTVPPELERIVNKALAKDKNLRYQTAGQMNKDLNKFMNMEYPEFSPQDFSIFIKSTFSETYTESKRKLVEYAKVQFGTEEKSKVTETMSLVTLGDEESELHAPQGLQPSAQVRASESTSDDPNQQLIVDLQGLKVDPSQTRSWKTQMGQSPTSAATTAGWHQAASPRSTTTITKTKGKSPLRKNKSETNWVAIGLGVVVVLGLGFYFVGSFSGFNKFDSLKVGKQNLQSGHIDIGSNLPQTNKNPQDKPELKVEKNSLVVIKSEPSGARIIINGQDTGFVTPAQVTLPKAKDFTLRLDKIGYLTYEAVNKVEQDTATIVLTLLEGKTGYLNLSVLNGGLESIIEINGQRIKDTLPLEQYKIPANIPIRIRVFNPFAQISSEKTIMVKENEKTDLRLVLTREANGGK